MRLVLKQHSLLYAHLANSSQVLLLKPFKRSETFLEHRVLSRHWLAGTPSWSLGVEPVSLNTALSKDFKSGFDDLLWELKSPTNIWRMQKASIFASGLGADQPNIELGAVGKKTHLAASYWRWAVLSGRKLYFSFSGANYNGRVVPTKSLWVFSELLKAELPEADPALQGGAAPKENVELLKLRDFNLNMIKLSMSMPLPVLFDHDLSVEAKTSPAFIEVIKHLPPVKLALTESLALFNPQRSWSFDLRDEPSVEIQRYLSFIKTLSVI